MKSESEVNLFEKNQEDQIQSQFEISEGQNIRMKVWEEVLDTLKCLQDQQAIMICCSENCQKEAPLCGKRKCQCKQSHQKCLNYVHFQHFLNVFSSKTQRKEHLIAEIDKKFDKLIDELSKLRQKTIEAAEFVFFNHQDRKFMQKLNSLEINQIYGKDLFNCSFNTKEQKQFDQEKINIDTIEKNLQKLTQKIEKQIRRYQTNLQIEQLLMKKFQPLIDLSQFYEIDSEIVTRGQAPILKGFFEARPFKQARLLYRASLNNYETQKFWQTCVNIPNTLTVILTQKHKVIGGFTPEPWRCYKNSYQNLDMSRETFMFSLTEEEKFELKNGEHATYYFNKKWGPQFGKLYAGDLSISDKCNVDPSSFCFYGNDYVSVKNPNVKIDLQQFVGQEKQYFRIVEWEVFQLTF